MIQLNETDLVNHAAPYRGPVDAVRICLRKYVDFDGRASRSEFWWFALFILLCAVCMLFVPIVWKGWQPYIPNLQPVFIIFAVFAMFVTPATAVAARRLHDTGRGDMRLLFFFLPMAMLISTLVSRGILPLGELHPALSLLLLGKELMEYPVFMYGIVTTLTFGSFMYAVIFPLAHVPIWMLAAIYIPLATFTYWWAKNDNAAQNGFYFDGLPVYKKLLIMPVLVAPVLYGISIPESVSKAAEILLTIFSSVLIPVVIFTYWWIQQGNPAQNKYDQTKTSRHTKLLIAKLPMAVVIYTAILLLLHTLRVGN